MTGIPEVRAGFYNKVWGAFLGGLWEDGGVGFHFVSQLRAIL